MLRTDDGWWSFTFTQGARDGRPTAYRRDSRIEVILQGDDVADLDALDEALWQSLVQQHERRVASQADTRSRGSKANREV